MSAPSPEWFEAAAGTVSGSIVAVAADAKKEQRWELALVVGDGGYAAAPEVSPAAPVVVTAKPAVLRQVLTGDLNAEVAYMRGDLKAEGEPGPVLDAVGALAAPTFRAWVAGLADRW